MRVRRSRPLRAFAGTAAVVLLAAACGGPDNSTTTQPDQAADPTSAGPVAVRAVDGVGDVLTDADGMTLYTADVEKGGTIACVDACADFWPPLTTNTAEVPTSIDGVTGELGVLERPDNTKQVTLDGRPLYTFAEDRKPGSVQGDGFEDDFGGQHFVWKIVTSDGTAQEDTKPPAGENNDSGKDDDSDGGMYDY